MDEWSRPGRPVRRPWTEAMPATRTAALLRGRRGGGGRHEGEGRGCDRRDAGLVIKPTAAENQVEGGAIRRQLDALKERVRFENRLTVTATLGKLSDLLHVLRFTRCSAVEVERLPGQRIRPRRRRNSNARTPAAAIANALATPSCPTCARCPTSPRADPRRDCRTAWRQGVSVAGPGCDIGGQFGRNMRNFCVESGRRTALAADEWHHEAGLG